MYKRQAVSKVVIYSSKSKVMVKISNWTFFISSILILLASILDVNSVKLTDSSKNKSHTPQWVPLCNEGHQYLFSDPSQDWLNWNEAKEMCQLLGGYLVRIETRHENNCLLVHAMKNELHEWWWTSGEL